jgi:hypothetical protein
MAETESSTVNDPVEFDADANSKAAPEPREKEKKKKKKIPGLNRTLPHPNGMTEYVYGFPVHGMSIGTSRYPALSKDRIVVFVGGGGGMASGIQNIILVNGCTTGSDGQLELKELLAYDCGEDLISTACLSSDGQLLACAVRGACRLYKFVRGDVVSLQLVGQWDADKHPSTPCINMLDFNRSINQLVAVGDDSVARVYVLGRVGGSAKSKKFEVAPAIELKGHKQSIVAAKYSPSGDLLATSSRDGTCLIWRGNGGEFSIVTTLEAKIVHSGLFPPGEKALRRMGKPFFNCLEWDPTGTYFYAVQATKRGASILKQWRIGAKQVSFQLSSEVGLQPEPSCSLGINETGTMILVGGTTTGAIQLFTCNKSGGGELELVGNTPKNSHSLAITGVGFGVAGKDVSVPISCSADSTALVYPVKSAFEKPPLNWTKILVAFLFIILSAGGVFYFLGGVPAIDGMIGTPMDIGQSPLSAKLAKAAAAKTVEDIVPQSGQIPVAEDSRNEPVEPTATEDVDVAASAPATEGTANVEETRHKAAGDEL